MGSRFTINLQFNVMQVNGAAPPAIRQQDSTKKQQTFRRKKIIKSISRDSICSLTAYHDMLTSREGLKSLMYGVTCFSIKPHTNWVTIVYRADYDGLKYADGVDQNPGLLDVRFDKSKNARSRWCIQFEAPRPISRELASMGLQAPRH